MCRRRVPARSMQLHEPRCARINYYCSSCNEVLAVAERASHQGEAWLTRRHQLMSHAATAHAVVPCTLGCGKTVVRRELQVTCRGVSSRVADVVRRQMHVAHECANRMVKCDHFV
jgi:hypothetical protein